MQTTALPTPSSLPPALATRQMAPLHESLLALPLRMLLAYARLAHGPQMMQPTALPTPLVETKPMAQLGSPVQLQLLQEHATHRRTGPQLIQQLRRPHAGHKKTAMHAPNLGNPQLLMAPALHARLVLCVNNADNCADHTDLSSACTGAADGTSRIVAGTPTSDASCAACIRHCSG